jgi:hypothetical protein
MKGDIVPNKYFNFTLLFFMLFSGLYAQQGGNSTITKTFGSFELPGDWVENSSNSRNGKYFYFPRTGGSTNLPTNISVEMGTNPYSADNPMPFGQAIQRQLIMQTGGKAKINGGGTFTEQGYPLIYFTIEDIEPQTPQPTTIQFYIVGEKKHIFVHVTDFHNERVTNAEDVAKIIVNSFKWAK